MPKALDFSSQDYPTVAQWWIDHGWPVLPPEALPKTGTIVFIDDKPICAAWLYCTDSSLSLLEWVVSNPETNFDERGAALDLLFPTLLSKAQDKIVCGFSNNPRLVERYKKHGFKLGDEKMDFLIRGPNGF